jgi:hypothetical protein
MDVHVMLDFPLTLVRGGLWRAGGHFVQRLSNTVQSVLKWLPGDQNHWQYNALPVQDKLF